MLKKLFGFDPAQNKLKTEIAEADTCTNGTFQRGRNGINHQRTNACC